MPTKTSSRKSVKKPIRKAAAVRRPARANGTKVAAAPGIRSGLITHTELASTNPAATRTWCEQVLGWKFGEPMATPSGPYHTWRFDNGTGGGLRANHSPEVPGSIPYCEVADIRTTFARALAAGATEMLGPQALPAGMGWIAIVAAPGGVPIGFWAP